MDFLVIERAERRAGRRHLVLMAAVEPGNMRPVFMVRKVNDTGFSKVVKEQHIRFVLKHNNITLTGIGFNMAGKFTLVQMQQPLDIVFTIDENEWNGVKSLQMKMLDLRISE